MAHRSAFLGSRGRHVAALALASILLCRPELAPAGETPVVDADHGPRMAASLERFKSNVRGLLAQHCLKCHGGEETHGELDLTTREGLVKGGQSGPAVVVGNPSASRLMRLIRHDDEPRMPDEADKLPEGAIDQIAAWIADGAAYDKPLTDVAESLVAKTVGPQDREFWSFRPLSVVLPPSVENEDWCRTPIDRFVLARLEAEGLAANGAADRRKLARRAYFDLIGLPPSPDEVEAFVTDPAADAYDRLIDRLLASPHYGERWGRHWLDLARFAESHGYEQDDDRPTAYHYRDFVIQALNDDMPYDQFVRWQIAGDELEPDNRLALMATGFLAAGTHATQITANQVEKERYDELDDMAATLGTAVLGLTIGCARCHDHKFDPIPQADYYRLVSTFTTTVRSEVELDFAPEVYQQEKAEFDRRHGQLVAARAKFEREQLAGRFEAWLASGVKSVMPTWLILDAVESTSAGGATFARQDDASILVGGTNPSHDVYTLIVPSNVPGITAVRLEALAHESLPRHGPGRAENGNFALSDFQLWAAPPGTAGPGAPVRLVSPKVTFEQQDLPISSAIDDNKKSAWAIDPEVGRDHAAAFALETALPNKDGTTLTFILKFENNTGHNLGRLRLALSTQTASAKPDLDEAHQAEVDRVNQALARAPSERSDEDRAALLNWYRPRDAEWRALDAVVREHARQAPRPKLTKVMIASEGLPPVRLRTQGADFFEHTYFLKRGDLRQKVGVADQAFLQVLTGAAEGPARWQQAPPPGWRTSYRRRALASWLTDPVAGAGHLAARVIVNRLWQHHLGRGIVSTPSDFGAAGERPTHPLLLDYLAAELIAGGWRLKALHKQIMTSAVYVQNVAPDAARAARDPDNALLWRRSRQRLEAEAVRDAMLAASGLLDETPFGPGSLDLAHKRRSIYFTVKRSQLIPGMMLYDAPDALTPLGNRATTIVAPQALMMLNNEQVHEYAAAFARRLLAAQGTPDDRLRRAYQIALARGPDDGELAASRGFIEQSTARYQAAGSARPDELALADFCQVLFGLNEFIYID